MVLDPFLFVGTGRFSGGKLASLPFRNVPCSLVQHLWQVLGASPAEQKTEGPSAFCCPQQLPLHPQSICSKDALMMQGTLSQI